MQKILKKCTALILVFSLLMQLTQVTYASQTDVMAAENENSGFFLPPESDMDQTGENTYQQPEMTAEDVLGEMEELRTADSKHFRLSDGSFIAVQYDTNVHYLDENDNWIDINNHLSVVEESITVPADPEAEITDTAENKFRSRQTEIEQSKTVEIEQYQPDDSVADVQFTAKSATEEISDFSITAEEYTVGMSLIDAEEKPAEIIAQEMESDDNSLAAAVTLPNITSVVRYKDVLDGIDLEYILHGEDIKENIIVKNRRDSYTFSFDLDLQNLIPVTQEDGSISLVDRTSKEEIYLIPSPFMEDSNKEVSYEVRYEIVPAEEFYKKKDMDAEDVPDLTDDEESSSQEEDSASISEVEELESSHLEESLSESELSSDTSDAALESELESEWIDEVSESPAPAEEKPDLGQNETKKKYGENDYVFTVIADEQWMNEKDRAYPVTIDPPIIVQYGKTQDRQMSTSYVKSGSPNEATGDYGDLYLGYSSISKSLKNRMFARVNELPVLPSDSIIVHAGIYFCQLPDSYSQVGMSTMNVPVYALTAGPGGSYDSQYYTSGNWIKTRTWNTQPWYREIVQDYAKISKSTDGTYVSWNLTGITKKWYSGEAKNYGLAFVPYDEAKFTNSYCANATFVAYNSNSNPSHKPKFIVQYRNTMGLEDYYTYDTQSIDRAGTGYVNDQTGQLVVVKPHLSQSSGVMPFALSHIYNSTFSTGQFTRTNSDSHPLQLTKDFSKMMMGKGWKLSVQETIVEKVMKDTKEEDVTYFVHNDADGTYHYYAKDPEKKDEFYYDEDGLKQKISKSGATYTMYDEKNNKKIFYNGILGMIEDRNGNKIRMIYNDGNAPSSGTAWQPKGTGDRLLQIRQQNNGGIEVTLATFSYYNEGTLETVTDRAGRVTKFTYLHGWLKEILHPDGTKASYSYGGPGDRLDTAKDNESQRKIVYGYYNNEVNCITEYGNDVIGNVRWRRTGAHNYAMYRDPGADRKNNTVDDTLEYVMFDYVGRTVNYYVTDYTDRQIIGASSSRYIGNSGTSKQNNLITQNASIGVAAVNLLRNAGLEGSGSWTASDSALSVSTAKPRTGTKSIAASNSSDSWYYQSVPVQANQTYTFSAYVNTADASFSSGGGVQVKYEDGSTVELGDMLNIKTASDVDKGWQRIDLTFTAKSSTAKVGVCFKGITGTAYADDLQLEAGDSPSNANLVENGGFEYDGGWTLLNKAPGKSEYSVNDSLGGSRSMRIDGAPTTWGLAYQDIPINLPGTETYILSGWAKANSVPTVTDSVPTFNLYAEIYYADGTRENHTMYFQPDVQAGSYAGWALNGWQFGSAAVVPKQPAKTVSKIRVHANYKFNANTAYFDNLSLVREFAQTYKYDKDGKLVSVTETGNKDLNLSYSGANLIKEVTKGNGTYDYTYDGKNNLTKVKNDFLTMDLTYDSSGYSTKSTMTSSKSGNSLSATAGPSDDKNRTNSAMDMNGIKESYAYANAYSQMSGNPTTVFDALGRRVENSYNVNQGSLNMTYQSGLISLQYRYNPKGEVSTLERGGFVAPGTGTKQFQYYDFEYDNFGNPTKVNVRGSDNSAYTLSEYFYAPHNGNQTKQLYGNNDWVQYQYDNLDRLTGKVYNDGAAYSYTYTGEGMLNSMEDSATGQKVTYGYDTLGRMVQFKETDPAGLVQYGSQSFDDANRISKLAYTVPGITPDSGRYATYSYNQANGSLTGMRSAAGDTVSYSYDAFNRLSGQTIGNVSTGYGYTASGQTEKLQVAWKQVKIGSQPANKLEYNYDALGNISDYYNEWDGFHNGYAYDAQNQLKTERIGNGFTTKEYTYTYDTYGNIREKTHKHDGKTVTNTYTYGNSAWLDLLTAYNGNTITYDTIGNPLQYYDGTSFSWEKGRQLAQAKNSKKDLDIQYTYDADGIRTQKLVTKNGVMTEHRYYVQGNKIVAEKRGDDKLEFIYDQNHTPLSMIYNGAKYHYITNLQGDVIGLVDTAGNSVASYTYNAWGELFSSNGQMANINPLRYRGYYYDTETGLYYLNSRYYDPVTSRFINADGYVSTGQGLILFEQSGKR